MLNKKLDQLLLKSILDLLVISILLFQAVSNNAYIFEFVGIIRSCINKIDLFCHVIRLTYVLNA